MSTDDTPFSKLSQRHAESESEIALTTDSEEDQNMINENSVQILPVTGGRIVFGTPQSDSEAWNTTLLDTGLDPNTEIPGDHVIFGYDGSIIMWLPDGMPTGEQADATDPA